MAAVSSMVLYALADALSIPFKFDEITQRIHGEANHPVHFGKLEVNFHSRIVSSHVLDNGSVLLMVRVKGNLSMLVHAEIAKPFDRIVLHLLNLAKMEKVEGWLENHKPKRLDDAVTLLGKAVVASFHKTSQKKWAAI